MKNRNKIIGVIGLGYVGLPLAVEFGKLYDTIGLDLNATRVDELKSHYDRTLEITKEELKAADKLVVTTDTSHLNEASIFIVTVPTPVDTLNNPDLTALHLATKTIGNYLKKGDIVIYESTVYPGATEEFCVPILEEISGLTFNKDFFCGYSPERINPGDKRHTLTQIRKVTSGSHLRLPAKLMLCTVL